jgi:hypothetical protein
MVSVYHLTTFTPLLAFEIEIVSIGVHYTNNRKESRRIAILLRNLHDLVPGIKFLSSLRLIAYFPVNNSLNFHQDGQYLKSENLYQ